MNRKSPQVAVLSGICVKSDAISEAVRGTIDALEQRLGAKCRLYTYACDFPKIDFLLVEDVTDVLLDSFYLSSDLIIYHYGVYYEFFNSILVGNGKAKQVVYYHNVTPKEWLPSSAHMIINKSLRQRANIDCADEIWAVSEYNKQDLIDYGIAAAEAKIFPLYSKFNDNYTNAKPGDKINILYVGRFVKSKGVLDLIEAIGAVRHLTPTQFTLSLVGNTALSDASYIDEIKTKIRDLHLYSIVEFVGTVGDKALRDHYERAHIFVMPSYHEGFCVPLVEAMRAGCIPIGYNAGNIPSLIGKYGFVVSTGDQSGLAEAIKNVIAFLARKDPADIGFVLWGDGGRTLTDYRRELGQYVQNFTFDAFAERVSSRVTELLSA